jgi:hypothetical protein
MKTGFQKWINSVCLESNSSRRSVETDYLTEFDQVVSRSGLRTDGSLLGLADAFVTKFRPSEVVGIVDFVFVNLWLQWLNLDPITQITSYSGSDSWYYDRE